MCGTALSLQFLIACRPPGTGKTHTLVTFISVARNILPKDAQILVLASSNVAVDNLVAGLISQNVNVVRIGRPIKVNST